MSQITRNSSSLALVSPVPCSNSARHTPQPQDSTNPQSESRDDTNGTNLRNESSPQDTNVGVANANTEFRSDLLCPLTQEPPARGCRFNTPLDNGTVPNTVFEYSALYRHIYTQGAGPSYRKVRHPIFNVMVPRKDALAMVEFVAPHEQQLMRAERCRLGLGIREDEPLTDQDENGYNQMINAVNDL